MACNTISCVLDSCGGEVSCPVFSAAQAGAEAAARLEADRTCLTTLNPPIPESRMPMGLC